MAVDTTDITRIPPHSLEAERSVLGCCLLDRAALLSIITKLKSEDFFHPPHRHIYNAVIDLFNQNVQPEVVSITDELTSSGHLNDAGGPDYLAGLTTNVVPSIHNAEHYCNIVIEEANLRCIKHLGKDNVSFKNDEKRPQYEEYIKSDAWKEKAAQRRELDDDTCQRCGAKNQLEVHHLWYDYLGNESLNDLITLCSECHKECHRESLVIQKSKKLSEQKSYATASDAASDFNIKYRDTYNDKSFPGLESGYSDLDRYTLGFQPGNLIILAARPSQGKTSLALNFARNIALMQKSVAFISLEMSKKELIIRLLCTEGPLNSYRLKNKNLSEKKNSVTGLNDWEHLKRGMESINSMKLIIDDSWSLKISKLRAKLEAIKLDHGLDIVIIDYLQLIDGETRSPEFRVLEVTKISRELKSIAGEFNIPIIALSQMSRHIERREGLLKEPKLSDLRDSGSIEQDADVVLFIHREIDRKDEDDRNWYGGDGIEDVQLIIAKNRNGEVGRINLEFVRKYATFVGLRSH